MENVTVRESARLRARRAAEAGSALPQPSTQPGSDPASTTTATPNTIQPGFAPVPNGLPGAYDAKPSHYVASLPRGHRGLPHDRPTAIH